MNNVNYEKPRVAFVSLCNEQKIAANDGNCMPQSANGKTDFYFDSTGDGWIHVLANGNDCSGEVKYFYKDNPETPEVLTLEEQAKAINEAILAFGTTGHEKQAFSGAVVDKPDPSFS